MSKEGREKMKKFFLAILCLTVGTAFAEELFPELSRIKGSRTEQVASNASKPETPVTNPAEEPSSEIDPSEYAVSLEDEYYENFKNAGLEGEDLFATGNVESPEQKDEEIKEEKKEEEEDDEQKIIVYMANVNATMTPNSNFSYCFGEIKFLNTMKRPVQALNVVLTYGSYSTSYNVKNLVKDVEQKGSVTLVGDVCNQIMDMPKMTIKRCVVENMEETACKKKVEFVPLRGV